MRSEKGHKIMSFLCMLGILIVMVIGLLLGYREDNGEYPAYLIECAEDSGFIPAFRTYYALSGNDIKKISRNEYEGYIYYTKTAPYELVNKEYYSFEATGTDPSPSAWEYTQGKYNDEPYDIDALKGYLLAMDPGFTTTSDGSRIDIGVTGFDDCSIVEATLLNGSSLIIDSKYAVFHDGKMINMPENIELRSIRDIRRYNRNR